MKKQRSYFSRENMVYIVFTIIGIMLFSRIFYLQVISAPELEVRAASLHDYGQTMIYARGIIFDAQNNILAKSVKAKDIYADPRTLVKQLSRNLNNNETASKKVEEIAETLAQVLHTESKVILDLLSKDASWVSIARQVDLESAEFIKEMGIPGIGFTDTYKRVYTTGQVSSSVLGIVNHAGDGVEGIEYFYNKELKGDINYPSQNIKTDNEIQSDWNDLIHGYNVGLTIDSTIQHLVEQELDQVMLQSKAEHSLIIAMDPMTGKILGMGSRPNFDPNNYARTKPSDRKNLAVSMIYEPGSTFKIITGAAAIEENVVTPLQVFNDPGHYIIGARRITNYDSDRKSHGDISFADGMKLSSNVVLAKVGIALGKETFYTYLKSFGFGLRTKIDLSGEEQGLLIDYDQVKDLELATMSFGQANLVTPIQLITAVSAVANGGNLMQPYLLEKVTNQADKVIYENKPKVVRQVISSTTSKLMSDILVSVVDKGTGSRAKISGIRVAGKTGTAQKIDAKTGKYSETDYVASFIAYAPADNPRIAVLVVVDTPKSGIIQGGTLAAPHAKKIIENTLQYYGIPVAANTPSQMTNLPKEVETTQSNKSNNKTTQPGKDEAFVPDLTGLTMRQAGELLGRFDLQYKFIGTGLAIKQFPEAGKLVNKKDIVEVIFSNETTQNIEEGRE